MTSVRPLLAAITASLLPLSLTGVSVAASAGSDPVAPDSVLPATASAATESAGQPNRVIPGRVVVQWAPDATDAAQARASSSVKASKATSLGNSQFQTLIIPQDTDPVVAAQKLASNPNVVWAGPDLAYSLHASAPNDPYFNLQWGLNNTGSGVAGRQALAGADISALDAWDHSKGSAGTVLAILDSGHRGTHPDLVHRQWVNPGEVDGIVGVDDDGNGVVDDLNGVDYVGENADSPTIDNDPTDSSVAGGHGIHVAGIAAAQGDNGTGISGVAQDARIMAIRVCSWSATLSEIVCPTSAQIAGINYAGAKQVPAANLSLGGTALDIGVGNALAANPGTLYVVSAGNDGTDNDSSPRYPCVLNPATSGTAGAVDNVVCVAATDQSDRMATTAREGWGSNWGQTTVDLAAPGTQILSAYPTTTVFNENFNSPSFAFTDWTNPVGTGFARSNLAPISSGGITNNTATQTPGTTRSTTTPARAIGIPEATECKFQYWRQLNTGSGDALLVEALVDGSPVVVDTANSNVPGFYVMKIPVAGTGSTRTVSVRFSFTRGTTPTTNGVWLDDMNLSCFTPPGSETSGSYVYSGGTSMAAPMVTGTVALLAAYEPSATTTQLRTALLSSVDPISDLHPLTGNHKVASGGRLNADAALAAIDALVAPDTAIASAPSGTITTRTASIGFAVAGTAAPATFQCKLDSGSYNDCVSPMNLTDLADGTHTFNVAARDSSANANLDPTPAAVTWTVDAAPDTTILSSPSGLVTSRAATFSFSASEPGATFACQLDGGAFDTCVSPKSYSQLADGAHTFAVRAKDPAGHVDPTPATANWVVDATPPNTVIDQAPSGAVTTTGATIVFRATEAGSAFNCRLDGAAAAPCTSPVVLSGLSVGAHTFSVAAKDAAGLVDATPATASWIVIAPPVTTPPVTTPPVTTPPVTTPPVTTPPVPTPPEPTPPVTTPPEPTPPVTTPPVTTPPVTTPPVTTPPPTAPGPVSGITVSFPKKKNALVSWNAPTGATSYRVRLSKKNSTKKFSAWKTASAPRYQFSGLTKKGRYLVQIVARNSVGSSPVSSLRFRQAK